MVSDLSTDEYTVKAVSRYSSLFSFPTQTKIGILLFIMCIFSFALIGFFSNKSLFGIGPGLVFGLVSFIIVVLTDFLISKSWLKKDKILNFRRCSALSLVACTAWFSITLFGLTIEVFLDITDISIGSFMLGFYLALILRSLVFLSVSFVNSRRALILALLQPTILNLPFFLTIKGLKYKLSYRLAELYLLSVSLSLLTSYIFIQLVDRTGKKSIGIGSLSLFKAYLANWTEDLNAPLEFLLEKLGIEQDVELSILAFKTRANMKAVIVVPSIHPGPFKNVGSSPLPYMIQKLLAHKLNCVIQVPHGLSGHELDLTSQHQNKRVMDALIKSMEFSRFHSRITPLVRKQIDEAKASCQIFGDCAFLTLTLSPKTMEDLPQELGFSILKNARVKGLSSAIVVDAHNSINGPFNAIVAEKKFEKVTKAALEEALVLSPSPFQVGAANIVPEDLEIQDGIGSGGFSAVVLKVHDQKSAYITIDGNNMVSGFREELLQTIRDEGIMEGEIFTTDSHTVNGVVISERGYYPVGSIKKKKVIEYIRQIVKSSLNNLEESTVSWRTIKVPNIKTIGETQIRKMTFLIEEVAKKAKRLAFFIFPTSSILLVTSFALF